MLDRTFFAHFQRCVLIFTVFFTPLLFFTSTRDQFELPKLSFLTLSLAALIFPFFLSETSTKRPIWNQLSLALIGWFLTQSLACLPGISLSWRTSLLGAYENFSGILTLTLYITWFLCLQALLNVPSIEKLIFFNSMAAFFSSLYAIGQHFGFDLIQWNPDSVNQAREFASLGNPNFLSAYLAMSLPLFFSLFFKKCFGEDQDMRRPKVHAYVFFLVGLGLLIFSTEKFQQTSVISTNLVLQWSVRAFGFALMCLGYLWLDIVRSKILSLLVLFSMILGLFMTQSRGGFLGALLGLMLWGFLLLKEPSSMNALRTIFQKATTIYRLSSSLIALVVLMIFGRSFFERLFQSVLHIGNSLTVSRLHIWGPALKIIATHPFFGVGLDTFKIAFPYYSGIEFNKIDGMFTSSRMAHDECLQIASTTGLLGLGAYGLVLIVFIRIGIRTYRTTNSSNRLTLAGLFGAALAYHVQNIFSFGVSSIDCLWFFILAATQTFAPTPQEMQAPARNLNFLAKIILVFVTAFCFLFPLYRLDADIAFGHGCAISDYLKKADPQTPPATLMDYSQAELSDMQRASSWMPLETKYRLYLGLAYEQAAPLNPNFTHSLETKALSYYQQAVEMSPSNAYYYNDEARVCSALSEKDPSYLPQALTAYEKAIQWDPYNPSFVLDYGLFLKKNGQGQQAAAQFTTAFALDKTFTGNLLSQMALDRYQTGDKVEAFEYLDLAKENAPDMPEVFYCSGILNLSEGRKQKALNDLARAKALDIDPQEHSSISLDRLNALILQASRKSAP